MEKHDTMTKYLVTGHRGFIGTHLMKEIDAVGLDIREGNDILTCDLPDADVVIHLAAQTNVIASVTDPEFDARTNILGTIRLAKRYRDAHFVFASSGGAIQEKIESPYGLSKYCAEEYIKIICKNYTILRFANIFGEGDTHGVVNKFIYNPVTIFGDGSSTRNYVYVGDLIRGIKEAIHWPKNRIYSFGHERSIPILELAKATGKPITFAPRIEGELQHSVVPNNTSWKPQVDVINYIREKCTT